MPQQKKYILIQNPKVDRMKTRTIKIPVWEAHEGPGAELRDSAQSAAEARAVMDRLKAPWDRECFGVLALNARCRLVGAEIVAIGTLSACLVHPREVFGAAIGMRAAQIVVFHNHPSGDLTPSPEDYDVTRRMQQAGELLGIPVVDQIVITPTEHHQITP